MSALGWRVDLPELDLPPGDYRERKPKGWRWRLPWSHDDDVKLPLVYLAGAIAAAIYVFTRLGEISDPTWVYLGGIVLGFGIGIMASLVARR